jgi:hypothetical protein
MDILTRARAKLVHEVPEIIIRGDNLRASGWTNSSAALDDPLTTLRPAFASPPWGHDIVGAHYQASSIMILEPRI